MAFKEISLNKFEEYNHKTDPFASVIGEQKFWYADDDANLIGTIILDKIDNDWSHVIMAQEEDGEYRFTDGGVSEESSSKAIEKLTQIMKNYATKGKIESDLYNSTLFDPKSSIVITDMNDEIKKYFKKHPEKLYQLTPRKFEELIASMLKDFGFTVELTKASRDGGRDIIASMKNAVTNFLAFVECKRYAPDNKIGVGIIRQVSGVHHLRKPSKSIIVTTSFFTKNAKEEAKLIENALDLKDYNNIKSWLDKY
ncbi:MAG: restriction endonuclease [Crocinitomicaceae bacterium]|nr:restriction endonuclease [Crocinitomicaceae bacterium]